MIRLVLPEGKGEEMGGGSGMGIGLERRRREKSSTAPTFIREADDLRLRRISDLRVRGQSIPLEHCFVETTMFSNIHPMER